MRADFVERVAQAINTGNSAALRERVGELHQADVGDLIETLDPELRPRLVKLMGHDFDFSALTEVDDTVREEIREELPAEAVAEGVRELDSDDAVAILADLPKDEQTEVLEQIPPPERVALARSLPYPENSAGMDRWARHRLSARDTRSARSLLGDLCGRCRGPAAGYGRARPAVAHQTAGTDSGTDR